MAWFNFLKAEGYFSPEKNPEPIAVKEGFQIPHWEALGYLEKLSLQIKEGKELELTDELLSIIKDVSEHPKDNYRTWYLFIKILTNLPNEKVTKEVLGFIPIWLSGRFDTLLQSSELCGKLLPKFLNETPTKEDIEKAELILHFLFQVQKVEIKSENIWDGEGNSYQSRIHLHFLSDIFKRRNLTPKVIKHCSNEFILELGRTIKNLLLDYPNGIDTIIKDGAKEYEIRIHINNKDLLISSRLKESKVANPPIPLPDFEELDKEALKLKLITILKQQGIIYQPTNDSSDTFESLTFSLNNDLISSFGFSSISKLGDRYHNDEKVFNVFSLIFRELLDEKAKQNPTEAISLLKTFCYDRKFQLPFYKRITLYVIGQNWDSTKELFWELVKDNNELDLFSKYKYQKEIYELLSKSQQSLIDIEKKTIQNIIDLGEQDEIKEQNEKRLQYWQLRWYSALREIEPFKERYFQLSKLLNITYEHFENFGEVKVTSGSISPISKDDLLEKSNQEIVDMLLTFEPKDRWEGPNINGLSDTLGSAVEIEPEKFADEIDLYKDVPYTYSFSMLNAFGKAWKNQKQFDWEKVLQFCLSCIENENFYSKQSQEESKPWDANPDWVMRAIANLLTDGMANDKNSFATDLLPTAKMIIQILTKNLQPIDDFNSTNMDYPTYSLNSTTGKVLRALLDYSLHRARSFFKYDDQGKWEPDMKALFETTLEKGIIDGHILEGMYFEQFYFLDKDWITEQVKRHYDIGQKEWIAFMSGFAFGNVPFNKDIYTLFYPHYEKALENKIELKSFHTYALTKHLVAFYFWGYEDLLSEKLILKFLKNAEPKQIEEFVSFIWQQKEYQKILREPERKHFEQIILDLWTLLANKYTNTENEEEQKILSALCKLVVFAPELNKTYTELLLKSCKFLDKYHYTHEFIETLTSLKRKGNPLMTAESLGKILSLLQFSEYIVDDDQQYIIELVSFLFEYGQKEIAITFCNNMAVINKQFFLRETYDQNTQIR